MRLQVLVAAMHQRDHSLLERMNIETDAIVVNQGDRNEIEEFVYRGHTVKWLSMKERGVGLSRNTALMRADADILLFADEDIVYESGYEKMVLDAFERHPDAQLILFNFRSLNADRPEYIVQNTHRLHWYNCLKYGAFRIAVRREAVFKNNITYSLLFGGGARYQAGEDNLFITHCLHAGLKGIAENVQLGTVQQENSTWFKGYDERYYSDRGALFAAMYGKRADLILLLMELKNRRRQQELGFLTRYRLERKGAADYRRQ